MRCILCSYFPALRRATWLGATCTCDRTYVRTRACTHTCACALRRHRTLPSSCALASCCCNCRHPDSAPTCHHRWLTRLNCPPQPHSALRCHLLAKKGSLLGTLPQQLPMQLLSLPHSARCRCRLLAKKGGLLGSLPLPQLPNQLFFPVVVVRPHNTRKS